MNRLVLILVLLLAACGESPPNLASSRGSGAAAAGVEIAGNIAKGVPKNGKLLVFVYANLPPNVTPAAAEPTSVGGVTPGRNFAFSTVPPGNVTLLFLIDSSNDGAIDPGDPIALLNDPAHRLSGLQVGDQVVVKDVDVDIANGRATAASIDVKHANAAQGVSPAPSQQ